MTRKHIRGGERVEKLLMQSKFAGEYERPMQEESGDEVRFMRDSELEEARKRPLVTRSHPVPTDEELRESFERNYVHENRDGSRRLLAAARERYGTNDIDEAFEKWKQEELELHRQHEIIRSFEKFLRDNATQIAQSRQSESRYYYYNGTVYRLSRHVYPTGSMTRGWPDGTFDKVDFAADPYLIDKVAREMDGKVVPLSDYSEAEGGGVRLMSEGCGTDARDVARRMDENNGTEVVRFIDFLRRGRLERGESRYFHVGETGDILNEYGIKGKITVGTSAVNSHHSEDNDHLDENDWVEVIDKINEPFAITQYGNKEKSFRIYTIVKKNNKNICVGVDVNSVGRDVTITNIRTAFARDLANALNERLVYPHSRSELETAIQELSLRHNREVYPEQPYDNANIRNNSETRAADGGNNSQAPENGGGRANFMVSEERGADYMDAVEKGDAEEAGRMVREAGAVEAEAGEGQSNQNGLNNQSGLNNQNDRAGGAAGAQGSETGAAQGEPLVDAEGAGG